MKSHLLTMCLLATLPAGAWAQSEAQAPADPAAAVPMPPRLAAQRQQLEERRNALETQRQELEADIQRLESEAQRIDPEGRLDSNQLFELLKERERRMSNEVDSDVAPALISISFFGCLLTGFLAWLVANNRKNHQLHQTVRMMVEKGAEIPHGLLAPPPKKPSDLRRGLILSTTGVGLTIFLAALPDAEGAWGVGLTLFFLGLGHLLVWRLQQGRSPLASHLSPESSL
ncbi:DUF6249 domain-containing protein [Cystobacter ferrugineus]|uniref:DUF6249 domain-containing protein n=1 Tax=Cystobacter ferrugineus TaxID=83449 RepID=A0A1L9B400_9BACT|nr:DUF6249 domain-containing protein [Cystobacter ferrugineus]OJH37001.1 hypothetical protein BON30_31445 [Cystobacter ferrugineus]